MPWHYLVIQSQTTTSLSLVKKKVEKRFFHNFIYILPKITTFISPLWHPRVSSSILALQHSYSCLFRSFPTIYHVLPLTFDVKVGHGGKKKKKSVDKILHKKKGYVQISSLLSKNARTTQEITCNDGSMPLWWTASHYKGDTHLLFWQKKGGKNIFPFLSFSKLRNRSQVPQNVWNTLWNAHIACAQPPCRYQRKTTLSLFIQKKEKKFIYYLTKVIERWQKVRWKQSVTHSWWNVFFSLSITSFINPRFFFTPSLFLFSCPEEQHIECFFCVWQRTAIFINYFDKFELVITSCFNGFSCLMLVWVWCFQQNQSSWSWHNCRCKLHLIWLFLLDVKSVILL